MGSVTYNWSILPRDISKTTGYTDNKYVSITVNDQKWTGSAINISAVYTIKFKDANLTAADYDVYVTKEETPTTIKDEGRYTIVFTGKGNFTGTVTKTFDVKKDMSEGESVTGIHFDIPTQIMNGTFDFSVVATDTKSHTTLHENEDYTLKFFSSESDANLATDDDNTTPRSVTRAGLPKEITTGSLQTGDHKDAGFGVFGYYTDGEDYASANTFPNFMYNQQVKWDGSVWKYEPVKYWPNEYGQSATSDDVDRVTFFSYAPWITVTPSTGVPVVEEMTTDAEFNTFVEGLNITYAKTTEDVVSDQASYIKYLAQNCYTGSTDPADLKLYIEETYHHAAFVDIDAAIAYVVSLNLKYIKKVEAVTVNTLDKYQVYIDDINGYAPNTTTAEIAKALT